MDKIIESDLYFDYSFSFEFYLNVRIILKNQSNQSNGVRKKLKLKLHSIHLLNKKTFIRAKK